MLVNMGDLPRPDQDVLSEVVFDYPKTASRSQLAVKTESGGSTIAGTNGEVKGDVSVYPEMQRVPVLQPSLLSTVTPIITTIARKVLPRMMHTT